MGLLVPFLIGVVVFGVVFGGFMLLAYMLGLYTPEPRYTGTYTPKPIRPVVVEETPDQKERRINLENVLFEAKARDLVRQWEARVQTGELTPEDFEDLVDQLLDAGALKSIDYSYRSDRKF